MGSLGRDGLFRVCPRGSASKCCTVLGAGGECLIVIFRIPGKRGCQSLVEVRLFRGGCLMANGNPRGSEDKRLTQQEQSKKPYRNPAFRLEGVFGNQALTCGRVLVTQGSCHGEPQKFLASLQTRCQTKLSPIVARTFPVTSALRSSPVSDVPRFRGWAANAQTVIFR